MDFPFRNILLCLRWGIGDLVMQTPLLTALRRAAPDARITALGAAPATSLLRADPRVDVVQEVQAFGVASLWADADPSPLRRWLGRTPFDLVLDPHAAPRAVNRELWRLPVELRESNQQAERQVLEAGGSGVAALIAGAAAGWGLPVERRARPQLRLAREAHERARALVAAKTAGASRPIAIAPIASAPVKQWPLERFAEVARRLARPRRRVLIIGGPDDDAGPRLRALLADRDDVRLLEPVPLDVLAAVLGRCTALLTNDTGVLHIGAAVGTRTVSVFGPTDPRVYAPRGRGCASVGGRDVACEHRRPRALAPPGCWASERCLLAGQRPCIDSVPVTSVLRACERALRGPARSLR